MEAAPFNEWYKKFVNGMGSATVVGGVCVGHRLGIGSTIVTTIPSVEDPPDSYCRLSTGRGGCYNSCLILFAQCSCTEGCGNGQQVGKLVVRVDHESPRGADALSRNSVHHA